MKGAASLDEFFNELRLISGSSLSDTVKCSQQAFSKAPSGISHSIFKECFERMLDFLCSRESLDFHARFMGVWGRQIIAIDGSKIPLPNRKALLEKYGSSGRESSSPTAIASVAFDVLNDRVLDAQLEPISIDERTLAIRHMENIKSKARTNLLYTMFVFDRGYASKNLISYIEDTIHARYLFRLRTKFNTDIDAVPAPLEQNYKLIKDKIGLTNFRGYSENSVLQEFWISMLLANLSLTIKRETDGIIDSTINQKGNKNRYMTNMNELIGYLSRHFGEYMDADTLTQKFDIIRCIFDFAISHRVQDKKGSGVSSPRTAPRKVKHHYNNKTTH